MKTLIKTMMVSSLLALVASGCSSGGGQGGGQGGGEKWPTSQALADKSPRQLLDRCYNAMQTGNEQEYLACYQGNDIRTLPLHRGTFEWMQDIREMKRALVKRYGADADVRFSEMSGSTLKPTNGPELDWTGKDAVQWDGTSDTALWYSYPDYPHEDQRPVKLRRVGDHWCFVGGMEDIFSDMDPEEYLRQSRELLPKARGQTQKILDILKDPSKTPTLEELATIYKQWSL